MIMNCQVLDCKREANYIQTETHHFDGMDIKGKRFDKELCQIKLNLCENCKDTIQVCGTTIFSLDSI